MCIFNWGVVLVVGVFLVVGEGWGGGVFFVTVWMFSTIDLWKSSVYLSCYVVYFFWIVV